MYITEDGHDANEKYEDLEGQGAIHAAAAVGSLPIVHVLIQVGINSYNSCIYFLGHRQTV